MVPEGKVVRIALVTPPYNLMRDYGKKKYSKYGGFPPLGIGYVAAALEKAGHAVKIIDSQATYLDNEQILAEIRKFGGQVLGISAVNACAKSARDLAKFIKGKTDMRVVMGGPHPTCFPELVYDEVADIDFLVTGEGEATMTEMMNLLDHKERWGDVDGICFKNSQGKLIKTREREPSGNLDDISPPARHLYDYSLYHPIPNLYRQLPAINMITSRGCPYGKCTFCYVGGKIKHYRRHSPERIISEIKDLIAEYGMKEITFWDDSFVVNKEWVRKFCNLLKEEKLDLSWSCYSRANLVDKEILEIMAGAGCWSIFYGLESGVQKLLDAIEKGITLEQSRRAIKWSHEAGIETRGSFMLALPGENPDLANETINFAIELDLDSVQFTATYPEFGTKLYDDAMTAGKFMEYKSRHSVTYVPEGYKDADEVRRFIRRAYLKFYIRPSLFMKYIRKIKKWEDFMEIK